MMDRRPLLATTELAAPAVAALCWPNQYRDLIRLGLNFLRVAREAWG